MSDTESVDNLCKNCGHKLQYHLEEKGGKCVGDNDHDDLGWCIANCQGYWD